MGKKNDMMMPTVPQPSDEMFRPAESLRLSSSCLGELATQILADQFQYILAQESGVIEDKNPEYLHQMRVGFRRFQAALTVFDRVIKLPKPFKEQDGIRVLKRLGTLRDLDVQLQNLTLKIQQASTPGQQKRLIQLQRALKSDRRHAYKQVRAMLKHSAVYDRFKRHVKTWLKHPHYTAIATLPVVDSASDLLSPRLSQLLLHPAWLSTQTAMTSTQPHMLHNLRKLCKQLRYQCEFFQDFYPKSFQAWVKEIKAIQSCLGDIQDASVFEQFMERYQKTSGGSKLIAPQPSAIETTLATEWQTLQQRYQDLAYRQQLRELILSPMP